MSQRVRLHPAMIAIGVVVVGRLFGFVGLFVAVPILSLITICVQEFWVKEIDEIEPSERSRHRHRAASTGDELPAAQTSFVMRDHGADRHEDTIRTWTTIQKRGSSLTR